MKQENVKFSIIMPIYNTLIIWESLQSFAQLDYDASNFEVIIIDDGSSVKNKIKAQYFVWKFKKHIHIKYIYIPDKEWRMRVNQARNLWADTAQFEHMIFIDGDCLVPDYYLKNYNTYLKNIGNNEILVGDSIWYNYEKNDPIKPSIILKKDYYYYLHKPKYYDFRRLWHYQHFWHVFLGGNICLSQKQFKRIEKWDEHIESWWEDDIEFAFRIHKLDYKCKFLKRIEVYNVKDSERITKEKFHSTLENQCYVYDKFWQDEEYFLYVKQRFIHTSYKIKKNNIPDIFRKKFLKNSYPFFHVATMCINFYPWDAGEKTQKIIESFLLKNITLNIISKTHSPELCLLIESLRKEYFFLVSYYTQEDVDRLPFVWPMKKIGINDLRESHINLQDETLLVNISQENLDWIDREEIMNTLLIPHMRMLSFDEIHTYSL